MAQRRMLSMHIIDTDAFMDMPHSAQCLYMHMLMRADDDGFVANAKKIMRMVGSQDDDLKILFSKKFVIPFESGVCVIKHWRIHNYIQKDRYNETTYTEEKALLSVKKNNAYTLDTDCIQNGDTGKVSIGKVSIGKDNIQPQKEVVSDSNGSLIAELIKAFESVDPKNKSYYKNKTQREACDFLITEYGFENVIARIEVLPKTNQLQYFPTITTPCQLRDKWMQLETAVARAKQKTTSTNVYKV